jgi:hypothetical protein
MGEGVIVRLLTGGGARREIARTQTQAELDEVLDREAGEYQKIGRGEGYSFTSSPIEGPVQVAVELEEGGRFYFICHLGEDGRPVVVTQGGEMFPFVTEGGYGTAGFTFGRSSQKNILAYPDPTISRLQTRVYWWRDEKRFEVIDRNTPNGTLWRRVPKGAAERLHHFLKRDVKRAQKTDELLQVLDEHLRPLHQLGGEGNPTNSMPLKDGLQVALSAEGGLRSHAFICFVDRKGFPHIFTPEGEVAHFVKGNGDYVLEFRRDPDNNLVFNQLIASSTRGGVVFHQSEKTFTLHNGNFENPIFYRPLPILAINRFVELGKS